ncbi:hypothetical protein [Mesorhizobium sp. NFR06]|uniref:hypothetical protein n=1 Tax=Mesorhizobium sp. NFR06 TaxID=1566290 RepID=UPI00122DB907|nr:hypothetical protein [Mesorhizobium sp. NFR06]
MLASEREALTEWETGFVESIIGYVDDELTTRQVEKLLEVRDSLVLVAEHRGCNVSRLVRNCYESRLDLNEDDEDWIVELYANGHRSIRRGQVGRLMRCARQLGLIEENSAA